MINFKNISLLTFGAFICATLWVVEEASAINFQQEQIEDHPLFLAQMGGAIEDEVEEEDDMTQDEEEEDYGSGSSKKKNQ